MVDSKEIEELRALAFASIPAIARKAAGSSTLKGKRKFTSLDAEEGEIVSDEEAAAPVVTVSTISSTNGTLPVSMELPSSISTEPPSLVAVVSSHNQLMNSEENCNVSSEKASVGWTSKNDSGIIQTAIRVDSAAKSELSKFNQRVPRASNGSRPFRSATGSLSSRIPTAPLPTGGLRKEAEAFLASLNIPAMATSSHLTGFTGDSHNSLVIKFSDEDSDSDGDQDGQVAKDGANSKKLIVSEAQVLNNLANSRMGLVSQTTTGLISEIDRVKKQIAAIERAKGSPPVSKPLKSTSVDVSRQLNFKLGVPTSTAISRMAPVNLESLRQQIAAKESELKRRKQKGSKEFTNNGIASASSWLIDTLEAPDGRSFPIMAKSESEAGAAEVCMENVPIVSDSQTVEAFSTSNGSSVKIKKFVTHGPKFEQTNVLSDGRDVLPAIQASESVTVSTSLQFFNNNVEQVPNEITKPAPEKSDLPAILAENLDTIANNASVTPKRKRRESDFRSESAKRAKKRGPFSIAESSLKLNGSKEGQDCQIFGSFLDGNSVASIKVSGGIQSSQSKEPLMPVQGMPMTLAMTKPQDVQTSSLQKASDVVFQVHNRQEIANEVIADNDNNLSGTAALLQKPCTGDLPGNEVNLELHGITQDADRLKHLGTSTDLTRSSHSSPLRAMTEQQENSCVLPREQKILQGTLVEVGSTCASLPVWDCSNAKVQLLQGLSDQRLEYASDSMWKLQEEEDAADKALEEAQQHRRRCEVREHFARKQYRDAQEALHAANVRCEMLFQEREMLSASVKAAQLRLYSNRSSLTPHHAEGALISLSVPGCSGKDSFSFGTSMWARDREKNANAILNLMSDEDHVGSHSDFRSVLKQARTSSRFPPDGCFIAKTQQCRVNVNGLEEVVVINASAGESTKGLSSKPGVLVHDKVARVPGIQRSNPQKISTGNLAEIGPLPPPGDLLPDSVSQSKTGGNNSQTSSEGRPSNFALAVAINGSTEKDSHGFSSASFATDLWRDENPTGILGEKSNITKGQEANTRESNFNSSPFHLNSAQVSLNRKLVSNNSINEPSAAALKGHLTAMNEGSSYTLLKSSEQDCEPEHVVHLEKTIGSPQEKLCDEPVAGENTDGSKTQILTVLGVADKSLNRQDSGPHEAHVSSADSLNKHSSSKDIGMDLDEVKESSKETISHDGKLTRYFHVSHGGRSTTPEKHELPGIDPGEVLQRPVGDAETELDIIPLHRKMFKMSGEDRKLGESTSSTSLMTSAGLNLLFSHAPESHSVNAWKQLIAPDNTDETTLCLPENFESPLGGFRFYRSVLQSMDVPSPKVFSGFHQLDPHKILCMFEHRGKCNNDECIWQHKRDYLLSSSMKQSHQVVEASKCSEAMKTTAREDLDSAQYSKHRDCDGVDGNTIYSVPSQASWRWNGQVIKVPIYSIGSHFTRIQSFESLLPGMILKRQFGSGVAFSALHRQAPLDLPCLLDSSLKLPILNDGSIASRQLRMEDKLWIQNELQGHEFGTLGDSESLLEAALELFHYDIQVQKSELQKSVLYVLSRGLEANPGSVALWVVYLHLFCKWEKDSSKDELFLSAVQHNEGSYELWMMFINSRGHLKDRLEAYESAIITLGSRDELQCHALESKSSLLLDLALQRLNCLCTSDLNQEVASWISNFIILASEDGQGFGRHEASSSLTLVTCLTRPDLCILWICCAYVMLRLRLPERVVECLGCKQELIFQNIWSSSIDMSSSASQVMKLLQIGASHGKGCMKLDVHEPEDKDLQLAKEVFAANFVQCAAVCEGLDCSLTLAEKYFRMFSSSVELTLLRARLEEHYSGKMASLEVFEKAVTRWPLDQTGKMRLWNQYIECAYEAKGPDFVKGLLARCAKEVCDSDSFRFVCGNLGTIHSDTEHPICAQQQGCLMPLEVSNTSLQSAFQLLPSIVKRQLMKGSGFSSQRFSFQDAVFAYVNLAFFETLNKDYKAARIALQNGLNVAVDADSVRYCLKEIAVFTYKGLDNSTIFSPTVRSNKVLHLVDRCIVESQLIGSVLPLSRGFCDTIKRRRVSQFVASLVCPLPTDSSFLNSVLESIHGPTLLPSETLAWTDLLEIAEKLLEILPSNVRLATSICRAVQNKVSGFDSKTGPATLFWCTSLLIDSLCQTSPEAPEPTWVEAGGFLKMLNVDSLLEDFYWLALLVHPYSTSLWHGLLEVSRKTGNFELVSKSAKEKGVNLDLDFIS